MAQWVNRPRTDNGVSVQIKWRMDGRWQSETFTDTRLAAEFRTAVEQGGHRWPDGWVKGEGWLSGPTSVPEAPPTPPAVPVVTFADVALGPKGYFERQAKRARLGHLKPRTLHGLRRTYALHLEDTFGGRDFAGIDAEEISDWIDVQIDAGWAAKTIHEHHGLLSSILKHGSLRMHLRADNPCQVSELPAVDHGTSQVRQVRFFQPQEWALLRSCLRPDAHLMVDVALATGVRWGELTALRAGDATFSGSGDEFQANIHIVRAWSRRAPDDTAPIRWEQGEDRVWVLGPPKSKRPRWVVATGDVAHRLQDALKVRAASEYVFLTREGRPWRYQNFFDRRWAPARRQAEKLGLTKKATIHMLRHTTLVWSLAGGIRIERISEMIGHASLQITFSIYGGFINLQDPAMAAAMAQAMLAVSELTGVPG